MPDGKKIEKDPLGMKMGGAFSFTNTADLSLKGKFHIDISADVGKKKVQFLFTYDVK